MGLDVGTRTIGVAISDELGLTAQAVETLRQEGLKARLEALEGLIASYQVTRVVVGLPLNMDGSEGPRAEASRRLGDAVAASLKLPVEYWDERLSTVAVQRVLIDADLSRAKRKKVVDRAAAVWILQGWLDSRRSPNPYAADSEP